MFKKRYTHPPVGLHILGGLGNNMFQYAAGYAYAKRHNRELKLYTQSTRLIDTFKIKNRIISTPIMENFFLENLNYHMRNVIHIDNFKYLIGNFQDPTIFNEYRKDLLKIFVIKNKANQKENKAYKKQIKRTNSVSIHIRRTDYLTVFPKSILSVSYYQKAIAYIKSRVKNPHFFIFSDDYEWVKNNLKLDCPHTFVTCNQTLESSAWDMYLMSCCKHNIIANSSFSWWGAYLNTTPNKIVVCPAKWLIDSDIHIEVSRYIFQDDWIKIPNCFLSD